MARGHPVIELCGRRSHASVDQALGATDARSPRGETHRLSGGGKGCFT